MCQERTGASSHSHHCHRGTYENTTWGSAFISVLRSQLLSHRGHSCCIHWGGPGCRGCSRLADPDMEAITLWGNSSPTPCWERNMTIQKNLILYAVLHPKGFKLSGVMSTKGPESHCSKYSDRSPALMSQWIKAGKGPDKNSKMTGQKSYTRNPQNYFQLLF